MRLGGVGEGIALLDVDPHLAAATIANSSSAIACIASRVAMWVASVCRVT